MSALPDKYSPGTVDLGPARQQRPVESTSCLDPPTAESVAAVRHAVAALLSAYLGERRTKNAGDVYRLDRALRRLSRLAGRPVPGRARDRALKMLRRRGLTRHAIGREWLAAQARQGRTATLPDELLEELFPQSLWEIVAMMLLLGPAPCAELIDRVLREVECEEVAPTRARPSGGGVSQSTIESYGEPLKWVMRALHELRARGFPCAELASWDHVPRVRTPIVARVATDRSAPTLLAVRIARKRLDDRVKERLGVGEGEDELTVVERLSGHRLRNRGVWRPSRDRAVFELLCLLACREGAITELRPRDVDRARARPSGGVGPAIGLRPGKGLPPDEVSWKPIGEEALHMIDVYVAITSKIVEETPDLRSGEAGQATWREDGPLFLAQLRNPDRPMAPCAIYALVTGRKPRGGNGRRPLMPRPDGRGWFSPHSLRRRGLQSVRQEAAGLTDAERGGVDGDTLAEALLDHTISRDRLKYADLNTPQGKERCAEIAIELNRRLLATDAGARTCRDGAAYRTALRQKVALEVELARAQADIKDAEDAFTEGTRPSPKLVPQILFAGRTIDTLRDRLGQIEAQIQRLHHDPATRIPIPDHLEGDIPDEFDAIEAEILGAGKRAADSDDRDPVPVRDFITVQEYAELGDFSPATAKRHVRGEHLPYHAGDPRRPWEPDNIPVDDSFGPRRRRIYVGGINPNFFRTKASRRRLAEILAEPPQGWSIKHVSAPLRLPEPFASQRASTNLGSGN